MAVADFQFVVRLSGRERFDGVLAGLATSVFQYIGYAPPAVTELVAQLDTAVASTGDGAARLDVRFLVQAGACRVVVVVEDREVWRITRCLP